MYTRFVYHGNDIITGFNSDIDPAVWKYKVIQERERFYIGIMRPDGRYHSCHGVNRNGNAGTLLYVYGDPMGSYVEGDGCVTIADLMEQFIKNEILFGDASGIARMGAVIYASDSTMQAMLSDKDGRVLILEPGIGYWEERKRYSLITNYSVLESESTRELIVSGDDRYERAEALLRGQEEKLPVADTFSILGEVRQEGMWATRVSLVYLWLEKKVYYVINNEFGNVMEYCFPDGEE